MSRKKKSQSDHLSQEEVDDTVVAEAEDDFAWEAPIEVKKAEPQTFEFPSDLVSRAAFLARVHRSDLESWVVEIIRDRIEIEEAAFAETKRDIFRRTSLEVGAPRRKSALQGKLEKAGSSEEFTQIFAKARPDDIAKNLGFRLLEHYREKVRESQGLAPDLVNRALANLEEATNIKATL